MAPTASVAVEGRKVASVAPRTALQQCLVVSPSRQRAKLLERAAGEQGWETIVAGDAEDAAREAVRNRIQLAVIDLQSVGSPDAAMYRDLVEQLSTESADGPLLIVCGDEEDAMGEIWSRQLGVWMYLPGVDDHSDIAMLCGEARNVVEKLHG
jgi:ActR/RegA family two-component response regulator